MDSVASGSQNTAVRLPSDAMSDDLTMAKGLGRVGNPMISLAWRGDLEYLGLWVKGRFHLNSMGGMPFRFRSQRHDLRHGALLASPLRSLTRVTAHRTANSSG